MLAPQNRHCSLWPESWEVFTLVGERLEEDPARRFGVLVIFSFENLGAGFIDVFALGKFHEPFWPFSGCTLC